ncbi:MAG TPA: slipin family protein [Gemmatimonadaceae bacterium]|nr:slipin family protein [Gemmatimonadaceae bacterium]
MTGLTSLFLVVILALIAIAIIDSMMARHYPRTTVLEFERGLLYERGRFARLLTPGQYRLWAATSTVRKVDVRPKVTVVGGQEVLTADGIAVKASLAARYRVADPALAVNGIENYELALHTALQLALRTAIAAQPLEALLQVRTTLGKEITELSAQAATSAGLELISADLRDLTLPGELKRIFTQVAHARQEGLAALEKARGETAALRHLANAAQLLERNPTLMQLRTLQAFGQHSGNTLVLGVPASPIVPNTPAAAE